MLVSAIAFRFLVICCLPQLDATNVGDEGGFAPNIAGAEEGLDLLVEAIAKAGYEGKVKIAMDVAASEFFVEGSMASGGKYDLGFKAKERNVLTSEALQAVYQKMAAKYPIVSIEDPFEQDDWNSYGALTQKIGGPVQIVGDDLLVSAACIVLSQGRSRSAVT